MDDSVNMNDVLCGACIGSHIEMADYSIFKGADDLNTGLQVFYKKLKK